MCGVAIVSRDSFPRSATGPPTRGTMASSARPGLGDCRDASTSVGVRGAGRRRQPGHRGDVFGRQPRTARSRWMGCPKARRQIGSVRRRSGADSIQVETSGEGAESVLRRPLDEAGAIGMTEQVRAGRYHTWRGPGRAGRPIGWSDFSGCDSLLVLDKQIPWWRLHWRLG